MSELESFVTANYIESRHVDVVTEENKIVYVLILFKK